jgi:hypothetical protein
VSAAVNGRLPFGRISLNSIGILIEQSPQPIEIAERGSNRQVAGGSAFNEEACRLEIAFGRGGRIVPEDREVDGSHVPRTPSASRSAAGAVDRMDVAPRSSNRATTWRAEPMTARWSGVPPNLSPRSKSNGSASSSSRTR